MKIRDLSGQRFGHLIVVKKTDKRKNGKVVWECLCDCGKTTYVPSNYLTTGNTKSCGCGKNVGHKKYGAIRTHDMKLYSVWCGMKGRCTNRENKSFAYYGGRGITVCDDWNNSFTAFQEWATKSGYADGLTLDRIDNNKGYSPDNCRWTTMKVQSNNRRNTHFITHDGETKTIAEWAEKLAIPEQRIRTRIWIGMGDEKALSTCDLRRRNENSIR